MASIQKKEETMEYVPRTCPLCGANLDPGESCNCLDQAYEDYLAGEIALPWEEIEEVTPE